MVASKTFIRFVIIIIIGYSCLAAKKVLFSDVFACNFVDLILGYF